MNSSATRRRLLLGGAALVVLGIVAILIAVAAERGKVPYFGGACVALVGVWCLLWVLLRGWRAIIGAMLSAVLVIGGAVVALDGWPWAGPDGWSHSAGMSGDHATLGDLVYCDGRAYDRASGAVRWKSADPDHADLVAATPDAVVFDHRASGTAGSGALTAYAPRTGKRLWSKHSSADIAGVTFHVHVIVTNQATRSSHEAVAYDARTGAIVWKRSGIAAAEVDLGSAITRYSAFATPSAGLVLATGKDRDDPKSVAVVRTSDGSTVFRTTNIPTSARVVDGVFVSLGDELTGRSVATGKLLWRAQRPAKSWTFFGGSSSVYFAADHGSVNAHTDEADFVMVDIHTGKLSMVVPPGGVTPAWFDQVDAQNGPVVWALVRTTDGLGVWKVGTQQVVRVPAAQRLGLASVGPRGWVGLVGTTTDSVGDEHTRSWAVSPDGTLSGPFSGGDPYVAAGAISVNGVTYSTHS